MIKKFVLLLLAVIFLTTGGYAQESFDLLIKNGVVVTVNTEGSVHDGGFVAIKDGIIRRVGSTAELEAMELLAENQIDAQGKAVLPGLVNTHTHVPMVLFRGFADDLDLHDWLYNEIFPAEARFVDADFVRTGSKLALAEMIRGGTTTFLDMYFFEEEVARVTKDAGMRAVLSPAVLDFPTPQNKTWAEGINNLKAFAHRWKDDPLVTPAAGPHATYTVSTEHLLEISAIAEELDLPIHIHVAETEAEMDDIKKDYGTTPVSYLDSIGLLSERVIAAHCVHLSEQDRTILSKKNVGVAHCPESNMKLCSGAAPIPALLELKVDVGLGTDGAASNNDLDMWGEMDSAAKMHKLITNDPKALPAQQALELATMGGARVLNMEHEIGSLEAGKKADIILVDLEREHLLPRYNIFSHLVYAAKPGDVTDVFVNGKPLMRDRVLLTLDEISIRKEAKAYQKKIQEGRDSKPEVPTL